MKNNIKKFAICLVLLLVYSNFFGQGLNDNEKELLKTIIDSLKIDSSKNTALKNSKNTDQVTTSSYQLPANLSQITTNLIAGTVLYMDERVKEEITTLMFEKFGKHIESEAFMQFKALFPALVNTVPTIGDNLYNYKLFLPTLQQAMQQDIKNIPISMIDFIEGYKSIGSKDKKTIQALIIASNRLLNGEQYTLILNDLLDSFLKNNIIDSTQYNIARGVNIYLGDPIEKRSDFIRYYLGCFPDIRGESDNATQAYMNAISQFSMVRKDTQNSRIYYQAIINLLKSLPYKSCALTSTINSFDDLLNAFYDIRQNQFPMAIVRILNVVKRLDKNFNNEKYQSTINTLLFIANLASAKDAQEIAGILKNTALPTGSYRLKRKEGGYVFINSYVGFKYQMESYNTNESAKNSNTYGLSGPIGISFGISKCVGIFASIIDIGQYLTYADNEEVEDFPELTLSNIFSPGAFFEVNIPNIFLTAAGGYSLGPWDREDAATSKKLNAKGFQLNLKIDMPLYTLHKKQIF